MRQLEGFQQRLGLVDGNLRRLALDHLLLHPLDRRRRVEDADMPVYQPVEEAA
jgi:hypothetical protein